MGLFVLDALLWIFGIRGHVPHHDGFPAGRSGSPSATRPGIWVLVAVAVSILALSLILWAAVWLAIRLL
jgi:hypothetical protein